MALNFPGPYEIRLYYTVVLSSVALTHSQRLNLRVAGTPTPGTLFSDIDALRRDDSPFALDGEVDDWVALIDGLYHNGAGATSFDYAELWKYEPESFDASFISTYDIAVPGASVTANNAAGQTIMTFRTLEGGVMKLSFMETNIFYAARDTPPYSNTTAEAIRAACVAGTVPWMGRDGSYPFAAIALYPGQNEATFKRRYR